MTNAELMTNEGKKRELDADRFVTRVWSFLRHKSFGFRRFSARHSSSAWTMVDFSVAMFFPMKTSSVRSASNGSNSQRPATKLKSCTLSGKRTKPFARITFAGRVSAKRSKQSREKTLSEVNVNDSNSG